MLCMIPKKEGDRGTKQKNKTKKIASIHLLSVKVQASNKKHHSNTIYRGKCFC